MPRNFYTNVDLNQNKLVGLAPGTAATDAVNKSQLDAAINGLDPKPSCRAATIANITLSGLQTIDGVSINAGDRILVKSQTNGAQNGIYVASASSWSLAADSAQGLLTTGAYVEVEEGATLSGSVWLLLTPAPITVGTTSLVWTQQNKPFVPVAGTGIAVSGSQISVDTSVIPRKFAQTIGDGTATSFILTHNLNTQDVQITVYRVASPFDDVLPDVQHTSANTITVLFNSAPTTNAYRVVVIG